MSSKANANLFLATVAFGVTFALWGLIAGLAPIFKTEYGLTATETSLLVAIPVLLGSLGRLPVGLLTDRYGGRLVFSVLLALGIVPTLALAVNHSYLALLLWGFGLGVMGTSFAVGIGFVSRWFSPERQGTALGIYGVGNVGQSIAVFGAPVLAAAIGVAAAFPIFGLASLVWALVFAVFARDAARKGPPKTLSENLKVLRSERLVWLLSIFYFLTFGGFVALGVYLPTLLRDLFQLTPQDAGARVAGFVVVATAARPLGGWASDRVGGQRLLLAVFVALAGLAWLLMSNSMPVATIGGLGAAIALGLGNGAVFKLVGQFFPAQAGTVAGLVGAAGGLGGFFPPIVLGISRDATGSYAPAFVLLSVFALGCLALAWVMPETKVLAASGRPAAITPRAARDRL
ncbi:MAG: NarK/NasA family nitrate transporter [Chloroflexi bacterium]|nr:NarK/NasA family nitrate transporter [Chloroflexota bacterium]